MCGETIIHSKHIPELQTLYWCQNICQSMLLETVNKEVLTMAMAISSENKLEMKKTEIRNDIKWGEHDKKKCDWGRF